MNMEREKNHPDFELMGVLEKDVKLADAVLAVGDRARHDGFRKGWLARGAGNTFDMYLGFFLCTVLGACLAAAWMAFT